MKITAVTLRIVCLLALAMAFVTAKRAKAQADSSNEGQQTIPEQTGTISGSVIDQSGVAILGASVRLSFEDQTAGQEALTDEDGRFIFSRIKPGPFRLTVSSAGLAPQTLDGVLGPGESPVFSSIMLTVATQVTEVRVGLTPVEIAQDQVKQQEKQRVFGLIPNFYVSYVPDAAPLTRKMKFELAWKSAVDPFTLTAIAAVAGAEQAGNQWSGYGQGLQGYAKRYGASYADVFAGTFLGSAVLPALLKQDPRYYYKGGPKRGRILHALAGAFICKGDNGRTELNYSNIVGTMAAGGLANLYYPARNRTGLRLVFSTALIRLGEVSVANIFQEFVVPKVTPGLSTRAPALDDTKSEAE